MHEFYQLFDANIIKRHRMDPAVSLHVIDLMWGTLCECNSLCSYIIKYICWKEVFCTWLKRKQACYYTTLFILWRFVGTTNHPFMESDLALSQSVLGTRLVPGGGVVRETACASDAGRVAMDFSPWMSAKFPPNAGLQGSRKQCTDNKSSKSWAPSFVFLSSCHEAFVKLVAERNLDVLNVFAPREVCRVIKPWRSLLL